MLFVRKYEKGGDLIVAAMMSFSDDTRNYSALEEIYNKHKKHMLYIATKILGSERAEDAVHDVFVNLIENFGENDKTLKDKPRQYFIKMTRNHSLNIRMREQAREPETVSLEDDIIEYDASLLLSTTPEEDFLNKESVESLAVLVRKLAPSMRKALEYKYMDGYSNSEIAETLSISQSAVSTRLNKARVRLNELIESEVDDYVY